MKMIRTLMGIAILMGLTTVWAGHDHGSKNISKIKKNVTVKGEVVDLTCYMSHGAKGEDHGKTCGAECLEKGMPVGLMDAKEKLYLVVTNKHESANKALVKYVGQQVSITGDVIEGNGVTMLMMSKVTK